MSEHHGIDGLFAHAPHSQSESRDIFLLLATGWAHHPHHGLMNVRLTVHLGLVVSEGCGIRAGDETRTWEPGRILFFDDSYEHEAWNRGASDRVVLILEAWNPHLTAAEREGVEIFFKLSRDWLDQFDVYRCS